jgi:hypothetical protein
MNQHPLLRAYMAGIAVPTAFMLVAMTVFIVARFVYNVPLQIERVLVFPMAVVPNLWGAWNILYIALLWKRQLSIGLFGAVLPFLLAPLGYMVTRLVGLADSLHILSLLPFAFPIGLVVYYLAWKYLVGPLNRIVGIA